MLSPAWPCCNFPPVSQHNPAATGALATAADSVRPSESAAGPEDSNARPPGAESDPDFNPDVELESHDSSAEGASFGEKCSGDEEELASQAVTPGSPSRPKCRRNRKNKSTLLPVPESFQSPSTSPHVPTELAPIDLAAWPSHTPDESSDTDTRPSFPRTALAVETQEHITTKQGEDCIVSIRFDMGASTMVVLNGRLSPDELREATYALPGFTRVVGIPSLLHGVDLPPPAPDVVASAFPSA